MTEKKKIIIVTVLAAVIAILICLVLFKIPQRIKSKFGTSADKEIYVHEEQIDIEGLDKKITIFFVADAHICLCDERDEEIKEDCDSRYLDFMRDSRGSEENFSLVMDYVRKENPDMVIFGGDITDEATYASIDYVKEEINKLNCPYYYLMGNHDFMYGDEYFSEKAYSEYFSRYDDINEVKAGCQTVCFDEFNLLLLDDNNNQVCDETLQAIDFLQKDNKPVIIAQHVPFVPTYGDSDLIERTNEMWGTAYQDYSRVLMGEHANKPNDTTAKLIDYVSDSNNSVKMILAGHVHFFHEDYMSENTKQLVVKPAFERGLIKLVLY